MLIDDDNPIDTKLAVDSIGIKCASGAARTC